MKRRNSRRILFAVLVFVVVALLIAYMSINHLIERTIEVEGTNSLNLATSLGGARLSLLGGRLSLDDLQIASPEGFKSPYILALEHGSVQVSYGELLKEPVHISQVTLQGPAMVVEQAGGKINLEVLKELPPRTREPMEVIIDRLVIENARVVLRPGLPGLDKEVVVPVPQLELKEIGTGEGSRNGAALKQVAMEIIAALGARAGQADLSKQLQATLEKDLQGILDKVGEQAQEKIERLAKPLEDLMNQPIDKALGNRKRGNNSK